MSRVIDHKVNNTTQTRLDVHAYRVSIIVECVRALRAPRPTSDHAHETAIYAARNAELEQQNRMHRGMLRCIEEGVMQARRISERPLSLGPADANELD